MDLTVRSAYPPIGVIHCHCLLLMLLTTKFSTRTCMPWTTKIVVHRPIAEKAPKKSAACGESPSFSPESHSYTIHLMHDRLHSSRRDNCAGIGWRVHSTHSTHSPSNVDSELTPKSTHSTHWPAADTPSQTWLRTAGMWLEEQRKCEDPKARYCSFTIGELVHIPILTAHYGESP
jgi:hypothetical protein